MPFYATRLSESLIKVSKAILPVQAAVVTRPPALLAHPLIVFWMFVEVLGLR